MRVLNLGFWTLQNPSLRNSDFAIDLSYLLRGHFLVPSTSPSASRSYSNCNYCILWFKFHPKKGLKCQRWPPVGPLAWLATKAKHLKVHWPSSPRSQSKMKAEKEKYPRFLKSLFRVTLALSPLFRDMCKLDSLVSEMPSWGHKVLGLGNSLLSVFLRWLSCSKRSAVIESSITVMWWAERSVAVNASVLECRTLASVSGVGVNGFVLKCKGTSNRSA